MTCKKRFEAQGSTFNISGCTSQEGFSLIELLVTIVLSSIVMGAIYSVYRVQTRSMKVQENRMEAQQYARSVLDLMVREIRNVGYFPVGACSTTPANSDGIITADAQSFQFVYDADADNDCAGPDENIAYAYAAANKDITRAVDGGAAQVLTDGNATNLDLKYFQQDGTELTRPVTDSDLKKTIKRVLISITVQSKDTGTEFGGGQINATMTSNVDLRNR